MGKRRKRPTGPRKGPGLRFVKEFMRKAKAEGATRDEMRRHYQAVGSPRGATLTSVLDQVFGKRGG